ncbi:hypothetical protein N7539_006414 [Penicillium diatomitis]|uniref:Probable E3 ubiquitin ligase complex SCF subunit sconB n=1 Tax=Penicillium diatomitis TaxID=2819901 RepID=A0A9W9X3C8_9EURO|nr:uncharacterized protein N7539_006414 [Penicillium diatomitis]KAJ5482968.1 hypothetical protein N7539_006414 [Penicillium diatomitis]
MGEQRHDDAEQQLSANDSLGQFSFAPATRTTVVTTTTTTTTSFPPLLIKPPRATKDLDPRLYPLASLPTPANLKNVRFKIGNQSIIFKEPNDTLAALTENSRSFQLNEKNDALQASNGSIRSVNSFATEDDNVTRRLAPPRPVRQVNQPSPQHSQQQRPVSPISISEPRPIIVPRTRRVPSEPVIRRNRPASSSTHLSAGLATPGLENNVSGLGESQAQGLGQRALSAALPRRETLLRSPLSTELEHAKPNDHNLGQQLPLHTESQRSGLIQSAAATSHPASFDQNTSFESSENASQRRPELTTQLSAIENAMAQDMCLPSPSLSPVAAMNALHGEASFDCEEPDVDTDSSADNGGPRYTKALRRLDADPSRGRSLAASQTASAPSLMDMPQVLQFFDSVPDELKSYMMYQFLRRCPKPTLHFVAEVVNPTLKCDFLTLLPLELSLNIVKYFDVQTMCRASQVSKKWRHIVSSDEKTWKELLDRDGYALSEGELERAIREGWGWQCSISNNFERDLSKAIVPVSWPAKEGSPIASSSQALEPIYEPSSTPIRRAKRKANTRTPSRKLAKREIAASEAPYAAASAAAAAVSYPDVGMPSLRGLYLYKALYRRHHAIRQGWMNPDVKPQHLAFRAHDRHVVTCLQFDTDKILTGSDDTNINVYDTKTGALKATLEGHEGGVWALEYHGNTLVSGSTDRSVRVWDIERARCTQVFNGHTSTVRCLQIILPTEIGKDAHGRMEIMPKVPLIITGSRDSNLRVWKLPMPGDREYFPSGALAEDTDCPYFVRTLSGHSHSVRAIAAHGDTLVSGSYDCTVRVWKISTGQVLHTLQGHSLKVYSVVLDHKRNRCISGAMDHLVKVWSLDDGSLLYNLEGHNSLVGLLSLQNDFLVSAAADSTLRIWDPEHGHCRSKLSAHTGAITCFQHDGYKVISGSDRTLKMWDVSTGACVRDLLTDLSGVWQVKFNDRRCVAAVQRDNLTYIEVLDFGAARDGVPDTKLGKRIVVNRRGREIAAGNVDSGSDSD